MKTKIINIGNSKGIILNKTILEKYGIKDVANLSLKDDKIEITPVKVPRKNWAEQFAKYSKSETENTMIPDVFEDEEFEEWK